MSRIFESKKPATYEGTNEEYVKTILDKRRPPPRNLTQAQIKAVYETLKKAMAIFEEKYQEYKKQISSEFKDLIFVQGELDAE